MNFSEIIIQTVVSSPFEENAFIVHLKGKTDCFVVDPGLEPDKIVDLIKREELNPVAVLITHGHTDHIAGMDGIKAEWKNCAVYIGEHENEKLTDAEKNLSASFGVPMTFSPADILLRHQETIDVAGIPIEVRHAPGHSRGHVVYLILCEPKRILFAGDVIFRQGVGRSDFPDGNPGRLIASIRSQILSLPDDTVVFSGHGPSTTIGAERRTNPYLI